MKDGTFAMNYLFSNIVSVTTLLVL